MRRSNSSQLVMAALKMAVAQGEKVRGAILHSDQGPPYVSKQYQQLITGTGLSAV